MSTRGEGSVTPRAQTLERIPHNEETSVRDGQRLRLIKAWESRLQLLRAWEKFNGRSPNEEAISKFSDESKKAADNAKTVADNSRKKRPAPASAESPEDNASSTRSGKKRRTEAELLLSMADSSIGRGPKRRTLDTNTNVISQDDHDNLGDSSSIPSTKTESPQSSVEKYKKQVEATILSREQKGKGKAIVDFEVRLWKSSPAERGTQTHGDNRVHHLQSDTTPPLLNFDHYMEPYSGDSKTPEKMAVRLCPGGRNPKSTPARGSKTSSVTPQKYKLAERATVVEQPGILSNGLRTSSGKANNAVLARCQEKIKEMDANTLAKAKRSPRVKTENSDSPGCPASTPSKGPGDYPPTDIKPEDNLEAWLALRTRELKPLSAESLESPLVTRQKRIDAVRGMPFHRWVGSGPDNSDTPSEGASKALATPAPAGLQTIKSSPTEETPPPRIGPIPPRQFYMTAGDAACESSEESSEDDDTPQIITPEQFYATPRSTPLEQHDYGASFLNSPSPTPSPTPLPRANKVSTTPALIDRQTIKSSPKEEKYRIPTTTPELCPATAELLRHIDSNLVSPPPPQTGENQPDTADNTVRRPLLGGWGALSRLCGQEGVKLSTSKY
jgi:hypothetical protein